jgi:hypothetical protein
MGFASRPARTGLNTGIRYREIVEATTAEKAQKAAQKRASNGPQSEVLPIEADRD